MKKRFCMKVKLSLKVFNSNEKNRFGKNIIWFSYTPNTLVLMVFVSFNQTDRLEPRPFRYGTSQRYLAKARAGHAMMVHRANDRGTRMVCSSCGYRTERKRIIFTPKSVPNYLKHS